MISYYRVLRDDVRYQDLLDFRNILFKRMYVKCLAMGEFNLLFLRLSPLETPPSNITLSFSFTLLSCSYVQLMEGIVSKNLISYSIEPSHSTVHFLIKIIEKKNTTLVSHTLYFRVGMVGYFTAMPIRFSHVC